MVKAIIIFLVICIFFALGSALYFLVQDEANSKRMVKALTWRIGLSLLLFVVLLFAFAMGWIVPHQI